MQPLGLSHLLNVPAAVKLVLEVHYTDGYPDTLPELSLEPLEGSIEEEELETLMSDLRRVVRCLLRSVRCIFTASRARRISAWR